MSDDVDRIMTLVEAYAGEVVAGLLPFNDNGDAILAARAALEAEMTRLAEERGRLRLTVIRLDNGARDFGLSDELVDEWMDALAPDDRAALAAP